MVRFGTFTSFWKRFPVNVTLPSNDLFVKVAEDHVLLFVFTLHYDDVILDWDLNVNNDVNFRALSDAVEVL